MTEQSTSDELLAALNTSFGGLRAEYFHDELFGLFTQPSYWPELMSARPCMLVGGRGTGKTTVLRGLSYQGQSHLNDSRVDDWTYIGLYWRIDTSVVRAFRGAGIDEEAWVRLFSHYTNLVFVQLVLEFFGWYEHETDHPIGFDPRGLSRAATALHVPRAQTLTEFSESLKDSMIDFEAYINNVGGSPFPQLSMPGRPLKLLLDALQNEPRLAGKRFFFLLDEYENLENYQQRVINTLIRHSGDSLYTFKIGMRETGHREQSTLNPDEQLIEPADYAYIDIAYFLREHDFAAFASRVCTERLARMSPSPDRIPSIAELLPPLSESREAELLGIDGRNRQIRERLLSEGADIDEIAHFDSLNPLEAYLIGFWANSHTQKSNREWLDDRRMSPKKWETRLGNYQHSMLFTLRTKVRGPRKFYSGWNTYVQLAEGNIRYLLQLVTEALQSHIRDGGTLAKPVSFEIQTFAAQEVGRRNLQQLQGLAAEGAQLTRLVLGLGRIFQVMAANPDGHAPEVNQFRIKWPTGFGNGTSNDTERLLSAAVMHLAVIRFTGDKMAAASGETRDYDYQLHPIFSPFFVYSHRRKRRMTLAAQDLLLLTSSPAATIRQILRQSSRDPSVAQGPLPDQLALFGEFFNELV